MPGFDGTGPAGMGPMTGRGAGYCVMPVNQGLLKPIPRVNTTGNRGPVYPASMYDPAFRANRFWQARSPWRISGRRGRR